jgi:hypothetical protein
MWGEGRLGVDDRQRTQDEPNWPAVDDQPLTTVTVTVTVASADGDEP